MPKNRSRLLQMGFRSYRQYCKCYTFYFVIQLFSGPDKLEFKLSVLEQSMIAKFFQGMWQMCQDFTLNFQMIIWIIIHLWETPHLPHPQANILP